MAQIATVTGVVGTVFAIAPDGTVRTLKVGDTLQKGEILRIGANARVELAMADGTVPAAASVAAGNVAIGANAIVKVDENMALGDARPTAQEAAVGIQAIQQVLQALEAGGDLNEELEAAAAGLTGGEGAGSDFVQLSRVQLETGSLSYDHNTVQGERAELLDTGLQVLPEITLAVVTPPLGGGGGGLDASGIWVQIEGTGKGAVTVQTITLQLNLSRQSGTAITVDYEWVGGTATAQAGAGLHRDRRRWRPSQRQGRDQRARQRRWCYGPAATLFGWRRASGYHRQQDPPGDSRRRRIPPDTC